MDWCPKLPQLSQVAPFDGKWFYGSDHYILLQSSGDFDPEAVPELEIPLDRSEILIRKNLRKHRISIRTKMISRYHDIMKFLEMIRSLQLLIRNDISMIPGNFFGLPDG